MFQQFQHFETLDFDIFRHSFSLLITISLTDIVIFLTWHFTMNAQVCTMLVFSFLSFTSCRLWKVYALLHLSPSALPCAHCTAFLLSTWCNTLQSVSILNRNKWIQRIDAWMDEWVDGWSDVDELFYCIKAVVLKKENRWYVMVVYLTDKLEYLV